MNSAPNASKLQIFTAILVFNHLYATFMYKQFVSKTQFFLDILDVAVEIYWYQRGDYKAILISRAIYAIFVVVLSVGIGIGRAGALAQPRSLNMASDQNKITEIARKFIGLPPTQ